MTDLYALSPPNKALWLAVSAGEAQRVPDLIAKGGQHTLVVTNFSETPRPLWEAVFEAPTETRVAMLIALREQGLRWKPLGKRRCSLAHRAVFKRDWSVMRYALDEKEWKSDREGWGPFFNLVNHSAKLSRQRLNHTPQIQTRPTMVKVFQEALTHVHDHPLFTINDWIKSPLLKDAYAAFLCVQGQAALHGLDSGIDLRDALTLHHEALEHLAQVLPFPSSTTPLLSEVPPFLKVLIPYALFTEEHFEARMRLQQEDAILLSLLTPFFEGLLRLGLTPSSGAFFQEKEKLVWHTFEELWDASLLRAWQHVLLEKQLDVSPSTPEQSSGRRRL